MTERIFCQKCGLCRDPLTDKLRPMVPGTGSESADLMIVGMNPGTQEQQRLIPFIGRSGNILDDALLAAGIQRPECYITNAVKHALPEDRKNLRKSEIEACRPFLEIEISHIKPKVIVALGGDAIAWFTGNKKISSQRGRPVELGPEHGNAILVPTYHPAYFLYKGSEPKELIEDLTTASRLLKEGLELDYTDVTIVREMGDYSLLVDQISQNGGRVAFDLETTGLCHICHEITDIVFSAEEGTAHVVPLLVADGEGWKPGVPEQVRDFAFDLVRDRDISKIPHGGCFDYKMLLGKGIIQYEDMDSWFWDTLYAQHALIDEHPPLNLEYLAASYTTMAAWDQKKAEIESKYGKGAVWKMTMKDRADYGAGDGDATWRIFLAQRERVSQLWGGDFSFYDEIVRPALPVLTEIMTNGFAVDLDQLEEIRRSYKRQLRVLDRKIMEVLGFDPRDEEMLQKLEVPEPTKDEDWEFNVNSDDQMVRAIESQLNIYWPRDRDWFLTKKDQKPSSRKEVRNAMAEMFPHEIWNLWRDRKKVSKTLSQYITDAETLHTTHGTSDSPRSIPAKLCPETNKIYTSLKPHGTRTGRRASSDPNLQNAPKRDDEDTEVKASLVRTVFIPSSVDKSLLACDFDSAEIWTAAYLSMDPELLRIIDEGLDMHSMTAARVYGREYEEFVAMIEEGNRLKSQQKPVPKELEQADQQRTRAKVVNFGGILYGGGARRISRDIGTSESEAQQLLDEVAKVYQVFYEWRETQVAHIRDPEGRGYVETAYRRRRHLTWPEEDWKQEHVEREAFNSPIQGTVADHMLRVMPRVREALQDPYQGDIVLEMHDELIAEVLTESAESALEDMIEAMTLEIPAFGKPLPVSGEVRSRWKPIN